MRSPRLGQRDGDRRCQRPTSGRPHAGRAAGRTHHGQGQAFGWHAVRVDGNDIEALVTAFDGLREHRGSPSVLICDTRVGSGVPLLENREKAHFMRVETHEWQVARDQLEEGRSR